MATQYNLDNNYIKLNETNGTLFNFGTVPVQVADSSRFDAPSIILKPGMMKTINDATVYARAYPNYSVGGKTLHATLNVVDFKVDAKGGDDDKTGISDVTNAGDNIVIKYKDGTTKSIPMATSKAGLLSFYLDDEGYLCAKFNSEQEEGK